MTMLVMESAGLFTRRRPNPPLHVLWQYPVSLAFSERKRISLLTIACFPKIIHILYYSGKYGRWTPAEKAAFLTGLKRFGRGKWKEIAKLIPTRSTGELCLQHEKPFFRHCSLLTTFL